MGFKPQFDGHFPTLGWTLLDWYETYLTVPSGPKAGKPFELTDDQARFVLRFYELHARTGQRIYRRGARRKAKGKGKSPHLAAMCAGELCGPVLFDGWDADGQPVGRPQPTPWIQIAAVSADQTGNTYAPLYQMLSGSPAIDEFGIDLGLTRIYLPGAVGRIESVTSSAGTREGQTITFYVMDETHLWTPTNGGRKLAATIRRNAAKMNGSGVESTNAHKPGQHSVAEDTYNAHLKGVAGLLYDADDVPEVEDLTDTKAVKRALEIAYEGAPWVDLDRLVAEIQDPSTDPDDVRRFYFNQVRAGADQPIDPKRWSELADPTKVVADREAITLGFDGSRFEDSTALIGCRISDGHEFVIDIWSKPEDSTQKWEVPVALVDAAVRRAFAQYRVWRMYADPPKWETYVDQWAADLKSFDGEDAVVSWWTSRDKQMSYAVRAFCDSVRGGELSHDGNSRLADHIGNARKRYVSTKDEKGDPLFVITKETKDSTRKIDAAVAAVLAFEARGDAVQLGVNVSFKPATASASAPNDDFFRPRERLNI
jgi:phage terminase large subunit-like protein